MVVRGMLMDMGDAEIKRLRKAIRRTYASQPHKIKCWLALLEMYGKNLSDPADAVRGPDCVGVARAAGSPAAVNPSLGRTHAFDGCTGTYTQGLREAGTAQRNAAGKTF
jgi:hypothetical protein